MQALIAIATFLVLSGGVVFGVSRYRNPKKSEQSRELQVPTKNTQLPIEPALISEGTAHPTTFEPLAIADPWDDSTSTIAPLLEEVMPD